MAHPMLQIPDPKSLPECLLRLSDEQKVGINETLANDESSSDDEAPGIPRGRARPDRGAERRGVEVSGPISH